MRRGFDPNLFFTAKGNLVAICTGSDACAEHEQGSRRLMSALCGDVDSFDSVVRDLKAGKDVVYPDIFASKTITRIPDGLQFATSGEGGSIEAILGYADFKIDRLHRELSFGIDSSRMGRSFGADVPRLSVAGAWDSSSFAVRVSGAKNVKALASFYEAMVGGHVMFAGSFFGPRGDRFPSGVILADARYLSDEDRTRMKAAQQDWCSRARLAARDDTEDVLTEMSRLSGTRYGHPGHLWVDWADKDESGVVYCLNPGYGIKADYIGPYTRDELFKWAKSGFSYHLKPQSRIRDSSVA